MWRHEWDVAANLDQLYKRQKKIQTHPGFGIEYVAHLQTLLELVLPEFRQLRVGKFAG